MTAFVASLIFVVLAEMGDKTQLATIALAVEYDAIVTVWLGTTLGMLVSNAIGVVVGIVMGRKIPERIIKWGAAVIFIGFGAVGLYENLPRQMVTSYTIIAGLAAITLMMSLIAWFNNRNARVSVEVNEIKTPQTVVKHS